MNRNRHTGEFAATLLLASFMAVSVGVARAQAPLGPAKSDSPVSLEDRSGFLLLDLTKLEDKTSPVIRLGYQSLIGDGIRRMSLENPDADIHHVPYFSISLAGVPSGDIANIFGEGGVSTGADVQLSVGTAYWLSYATPLNLRVAEAFVGNLENIADQIEAEKANDTPDPGVLNRRVQAARRVQASVATRRKDTRSQAFDRLFGEIMAYADQVIAYAEPGVLLKPPAPDARGIMRQRSGPIYDAWFARLGLNAGSATLFDAGKPFGEQFRNEDYNGYSAQLGYSIRFGGSLPYTVALSGGITRSSNVDELRSVEVTETQSFTSPDGVTKRGTSRKRTGLVGEFQQETNALGKFDLVLYPGLAAASRDGENAKPSLALDLFGRAERGERTSYGVGAYITKPGSPTSVYGGVNAYRATNGKLAIDLVAGFPF